MKAELKETVIRAARRAGTEGNLSPLVFGNDAKVQKTPDGYWVQTWVKVPLTAVQEEDDSK